MNKKILIPIGIILTVIIFVIVQCAGSTGKIKLEWENVPVSEINNDSIKLRVYVENSGSMDGYMCSGSELKDAVFDYVSDLKRYADTCSLYYINSQVIPYLGDLDSYIKDLTPDSFKRAGGNRTNTDLMKIFKMMMNEYKKNTVTVFVSDCILDIPQSATDFFGQCQVSIKNTFNEILQTNHDLGVQIVKLESKFDGYWYCGKNSKKLSNAKRPYYIWVIGEQRNLSNLKDKVPINHIIHGIKKYCAFSPSFSIPYNFDKDTYVVNHTGKIKVELLLDIKASLQEDSMMRDLRYFSTANPELVTICSINEVTAKNSKYSHVIELEITNPETLKSETITYSCPDFASWVAESNDDTGDNVEENTDKTTGILPLVRGVAEAYKNNTNFGSVSFTLKNK